MSPAAPPPAVPPAPAAARTGPARLGRPGYDQRSVVDRAVDLFNRHGYDATSMGMLAAELGVSKSAIYHHVPSKEHLLRIALDRALGRLEAVLDEASASDLAVEPRLRFVLRATVDALIDELPSVTLLLRLRGNTEMQREALERRRTFDRAVAELVAEASTAGTVRDDLDPHVVTRLLFGMVNSVSEWYRPEGATSREGVADAVVAIAFDGISL